MWKGSHRALAKSLSQNGYVSVAPRTLAATVQMDAKGKGGKGKYGKGKPAWPRQVRPATFGVAVAFKSNFNTGPRGV